ncbi:putative ribonuclease H-like domain-containing protein [Tanacetum coccineum]
MTHLSPKRNMVPKVVLMRPGLVSLTTARPVNNAQPKSTVNSTRLMTNVFNKAHLTTKAVVNTAKPKAVLNAVKGNQVNAVKASACWVWKPKTKLIDHISKHNSASTILKRAIHKWIYRTKEICCLWGNPKEGKSKEELTDESHVLLKVPRKNNMYSVDLKNIVPKGGLTCLFAKATSDESKLWHRRLGHINFKTMNKLVKGNLVRGLPLKLFENNQTCVACQKGKQHRASCKSKTVSSISQPLHMLHMDLFGPTFVKSLMKKMYCLVVTDDYSRFSWVFFLATKDETSGILKSFITGVENLIDQRVKVIRCDNETEFKNKEMNQFSDSKLPTTFWAEAVNTACYVQNRVLVTKPHNKTPYKLFLGRKLALGFMRPFGCPVTILNTIDHLGKFDGKAGEGFFVGYSINSKAFRPSDLPFSQNSMSSPNVGFKPSRDNEKKVTKEPGGDSSNDQEKEDDNVNSNNNVNIASDGNNTNNVNAVSLTVNVAGIEVNVVGTKTSIELPDDPNMPELEDIIYSDDDEDVGAEADMNNLDAFMPVSPIPTTRIHKDHPVEQIIKDLNLAPQTRRMTKNSEEHEEPKKVIHALKDPSWIEAMQEELLQIKLQEVWTLVDLLNFKRPIGTKWVYKNKKDERGIMIKNKERLVAQGYTQEEGTDYDEVFSHVSRIEAIRLFLAYASFKDFVVYQMDVKSAFLYSKIKEEVYVCQPLGFEDPDFPGRVYKVEKALYGLHQAPRAWYETLSTYLLDNGFKRGKIDKTLFIRRDQGDILLVQVYVDDIIFGSTKKSLCTEFKKMMHKKFQMSYMGKLTFFLGLQVKKKEDGIFISQDKYVTGILKKFGFTDVKTASTPMETQKPLLKDEDGEEVDVHLYRSMIGSLMYLTSLRPDIMFVVCAYARYQVNPKVSHLHAVKRIFRYLKGQPKLGLWYPKDLPFDLVAYTDSDYAGASLDRKSTTGGCQFLGCRLISWQYKKQTVVANSTTEAKYATVKVKTVNGEQQLQALVDGKKIIITEATAQEEMGEGSEVPTDPHYTPIITQPSSSQPQRKQKSRRPKEKDTQVPQSSVPSDPTNVADEAVNEEPSMQLKELMDFCTKLQQRVLDLENTKTAQAQEITTLKKRVKKLEKKEGSRTYKLKRLYKVGRSTRVVSSEEASLGDREDASKQGRKIDDIDKDAEITLVDETQGRYEDEDMFGVNDLDGDEVVVESEVTDKTELKSARPKTKGVVMQEPSESTPTISLQLLSQVKGQGSKDKGKAKMIEADKPLKKKDQIKFDEEEALRLQAKFDEEDRLAREKAQQVEEAKITWDDIQKSALFVQLLEKRRKHFAAKRAEEKRNKPPIRAQQRSIMCTYLKNMAGWKPKDLKSKSFANIQELFDKAMKRVNTFVDMDTDLVEGSEVRAEGSETREESSSKRAGDELEQENAKKQKMDDDQEAAKMKELIEIVPDEEEVAVDAIPLATKPLSIVDWKIVKEGKVIYYQIIRADGSFKSPKSSPDDGFKPSGDDKKKITEELGKKGGDSSKDSECSDQEKKDNVNSTNNVNAASTNEVNVVGGKTSIELLDDLNMPELEDIVYSDDDEDVGVEADMNNLDAIMPVSHIPTTRIHKDHPVEQIIRDLNSAPQTRRMIKNLEEHGLFSSVQNKKDERGIVIKNKARLVIQGYTQEEGIDYDEVFAPVIEEEVYACQTPRFEDPDFPDREYKVEKELYGLHQAPKAWTATSTHMETQKPLLKDKDGEEVDVHLYRSMIGSLLYLTSSRPDIMFVVCACSRYQVNPKVSHLHAVKRIFSDYAGASLDRMSTTGGCQFLGCRLISWQCKKQTMVANSTIDAEYVAVSSCCGQVLWIQNKLLDYRDSNEKKLIQMIKIHTDKNVAYLLTKAFDGKLMLLGINLLLLGKVNAARHKLTAAGKLMPLGINLLLLLKVNAARHNLQLLVNVNAVEVAFLGKPVESGGFKQVVDFLNAHTIKYALTVNPTIYTSCIEQFWATVKVKMVNREQQLQALVNGKKIVVTEASIRRDLQLDDEEGIDCLPNATIFQDLTRMGAKTTAWNEFSSTIASAIICLATNQKFNFSKYILESMVKNLDNAGKFLMYPRQPKEKDTQELMDFCTKLQQRVFDLENTKTAQAQEITSLKKRVKKLEKKGGSRTHKLKRLYKVGRSARIVSSDDARRYGDEDMFRVNDLDGDEVVVKSKVTDKAGEKRNIVEEAVVVTDAVTIPVSAATITNVELTLAQTLAELQSARPKTKGVVMQEPSKSTPTISLQLPSQVKGQGSKDKGKEKMIEPEKPLKKKDQIKLAREKAQQVEVANIAWDDIQAKIDVDYQLAERLQAQEQQELTIEEKSTLLYNSWRKERNTLLQKEQKKRGTGHLKDLNKGVCTYLKNMAGWKPKDLKNKTELVEGTKMEESSKKAKVMEENSSKRAGDELEQEKAKKQKVDDDQEAAKMKELIEIVPDEEEVAVDAIPLATKPLSIVDWKIVKEGKIIYYQIIRADGSFKRYSAFIQMLRSFDREDLETLWKLVKAKHGYTRP